MYQGPKKSVVEFAGPEIKGKWSRKVLDDGYGLRNHISLRRSNVSSKFSIFSEIHMYNCGVSNEMTLNLDHEKKIQEDFSSCIYGVCTSSHRSLDYSRKENTPDFTENDAIGRLYHQTVNSMDYHVWHAHDSEKVFYGWRTPFTEAELKARIIEKWEEVIQTGIRKSIRQWKGRLMQRCGIAEEGAHIDNFV